MVTAEREPRSPAVQLLAAMLAGGQAVAQESGSPVYRRPTLTNLVPDQPGAMIAARSDYRVSFAFTEEDGDRVRYEGVITQDDLFRALYGAGLLARVEPDRQAATGHTRVYLGVERE
jgi:hypothetical protein